VTCCRASDSICCSKNCPDAIVSVFERVQQKLILLLLAFLVDRQAEILVKLSFEPFHELAICNAVLSKELKGALNISVNSAFISGSSLCVLCVLCGKPASARR
jgi:hypothetical protein